MSDLSTYRMLESYKEMAGAPTFLASHFSTGPRDIHNQEYVEIDVRRDGRPIAIAIKDFKNGGRINTLDTFTNKNWTPPVLYEEFTLNSTNLLQRSMGQDPFQDVNFMSAAQMKLSDGVGLMMNKIRRTLELQASQIFQLGVITLLDTDGSTVYTVDFDMKAAHKFGANVDWDETTADPISDLLAGDELLRRNAKTHLSKVIFGESAWNAFLGNSKVQALLDNRRIVIGGVDPVARPGGDEIFLGTVEINGNMVRCVKYIASYEHPQTGVDTKYVSAWNVIGIADARRVATFGGIPRIVAPDSRLAGLGIGSMLAPEQGMALTTNAWVDPRGENISASVATRPLLIPVAIDAHFCLNAKVS